MTYMVNSASRSDGDEVTDIDVGVADLLPPSVAAVGPPGATVGLWRVDLWRLLPPVIVLVAIAAILIRDDGSLAANHWAYPATLLVCGLAALALLVRTRPRRSEL